MRKRVLVVSDVKRQNSGDLLLAKALKQKLGRDTQLLFAGVASDPSLSRIHPLAALILLVFRVRRPVKIIFGPGGIFYDSPLNFNITYYFCFYLASRISGVSYEILGVSISTMRSDYAKFCTKVILKGARAITVRDELSYKKCIACVSDKRIVKLEQDFVHQHFRMCVNACDEEKYILICPTPMGEKYGFEKSSTIANFFRSKISEALGEGFKVFVVPFHKTRDFDFCLAISDASASEKVVLVDRYSLEELAALMKGAECCYVMRLHSMIMASILCAQVRCIPYHEKVTEYLRAHHCNNVSLISVLNFDEN